MLKFAYFDLFYAKNPKGIKPLEGQKFLDFSVVSNFIATIDERNVISISHLNRGAAIPACVIAYHDNELLTCPSCTREISDSFDFCPKCGVKLK